MLCQQCKLPIGTCKRTSEECKFTCLGGFCSWKLDNFGRWSGWFEKPYLWTNGSFEFGFVVCTHSPSLCALKFSLTFWVLSESKKHADDPSTEKSITIIVKELNCSCTSFSSFSQSNNFSPFYFGDVLHPLFLGLKPLKSWKLTIRFQRT